MSRYNRYLVVHSYYKSGGDHLVKSVLDLWRMVFTDLSNDMHGTPSNFGVCILVVIACEVDKLR